MIQTLMVLGTISLVTMGVLLCKIIYKNLNWWRQDLKKIKRAGAIEKQVTLPNGNTINYGETQGAGPALLLIHGQMGAWEDYACVLPKLAQDWHVYAIDIYGHGESSHDKSLYYIDVNGNDLIWFIRHVIGEKTVVCGHSNGALTAAYIAAYGGDLVKGVVLEDPPVFSTQGEAWENTFAYLDTYEVLHAYNHSDKTECWEAYYLRHCYWGKLFMPKAMDGIANYAQKYSERHCGKEVKLFFLPKSITGIFHFVRHYDFDYGERFYDLSWHNGFRHEAILSQIKVPCVYLHAMEKRHENGVYLCAATREQAERAVSYIGDSCTLIEMPTSDHAIHLVHTKRYIEIINDFLESRG